MPIKKCKQCGEPYRIPPYRNQSSLFCGQKCYGLWQRGRTKQNTKKIQVDCHSCGRTILLYPSSMTGVKNKFCGQDCYTAWKKSEENKGPNNPCWKGGRKNSRGPSWPAARDAARARDGNTCQKCGIFGGPVKLHVHHKRPFRLFDNHNQANQLDNLVTYCNSCHTTEEMLFWRQNPDLSLPNNWPDCRLIKHCLKCGEPYSASPNQKVCDDCCTATCFHCGKTFLSRRAKTRTLKYCSRDCRNNHIERKPIRCEACRKKFTPARIGCKRCITCRRRRFQINAS